MKREQREIIPLHLLHAWCKIKWGFLKKKKKKANELNRVVYGFTTELSWLCWEKRCSAPEKESLMASSSKGNRVFMHPSRETINRDLQLYWKHQKMAFSSFRVNSEVSNQIKIYHTVDSTFLEPASDILHRTDKKGLAEKSQMCPFINNRLHFAWEDATLPHITCFDNNAEVWEKWYLLLQHHLKDPWQTSNKGTHWGHGKATRIWLGCWCPWRGLHHTVGCTPQCQGGQQLPGSLCVLVPLHGGGSPQLSTPPTTAPFLSVLLSYRTAFKLQTSD